MPVPLPVWGWVCNFFDRLVCLMALLQCTMSVLTKHIHPMTQCTSSLPSFHCIYLCDMKKNLDLKNGEEPVYNVHCSNLLCTLQDRCISNQNHYLAKLGCKFCCFCYCISCLLLDLKFCIFSCYQIRWLMMFTRITCYWLFYIWDILCMTS